MINTKIRGCSGDSLFDSVLTVLIFQFSPNFDAEASVPAVSRYRFWYLGSGSYFSIQGFGTRFSGDDLHFSHFGASSVFFRFHFGSISTPNWVKPKALVLEPKLTGT